MLQNDYRMIQKCYRMVHKCHTLAALKQRVVMARWVGEETLKELSVQVTVQVPLREVTVEAAHLRSPGGTKPMRRSYTFVPTPEVAAFDDQLAKKVHKENCQQRERVDAAFEKAAAEQPRIEARRRDAVRRAKNVRVHGCARGVPAAAPAKRKAADTPVTADGKGQCARVEHLPCASECEASVAPVEKALAWEGC